MKQSDDEEIRPVDEAMFQLHLIGILRGSTSLGKGAMLEAWLAMSVYLHKFEQTATGSLRAYMDKYRAEIPARVHSLDAHAGIAKTGGAA